MADIGNSDQEVVTDQVMVPHNMVGLIIGKGGGQINHMEQESGCKIQMSRDSGGYSHRLCTLKGNKNAISDAKAMIHQIIMKEKSQKARYMGRHAIIDGGNAIMNPDVITCKNHEVEEQVGDGGDKENMFRRYTELTCFPKIDGMDCLLESNSMKRVDYEDVKDQGKVMDPEVVEEPDYSAEWAEYLLYLGMVREAEIISNLGHARRALG